MPITFTEHKERSNSQTLEKSPYWKSHKKIKRKIENLWHIEQSFSLSLFKNQVIQKVVQNHLYSINRILEQNKNEKYKNLVSDAFLNHFRSLNKSRTFSMMHEVLNIFEDPLNGKTFIEWFTIKLEIRDSRFIKNEKMLPCGEKMNFKK